jgi:histidine triad (HIT) family protein
VVREPDCIFCKIVHREAPCFRVHEDDLTLTFLDIFPVADGHSLVVTKEHYENLFDASTAALQAVAANARRVAVAIREQLDPEGLGVFQLNGAAAGQTVFHYHMHLIPRSAAEQLRIHARVRGDDDRLRQIASSLASAIEAASGAPGR